MVHAERGDQMTPEELGEYVANNVRKSREDGGFDHFLFISTPEPGVPDICHVGNGPRGPANARLIAAAPSLLEALKAWDAYMLETGGYSGPDSDALHPEAARVWRLIRAVVAKATGPLSDGDAKLSPLAARRDGEPSEPKDL